MTFRISRNGEGAIGRRHCCRGRRGSQRIVSQLEEPHRHARNTAVASIKLAVRVHVLEDKIARYQRQRLEAQVDREVLLCIDQIIASAVRARLATSGDRHSSDSESEGGGGGTIRERVTTITGVLTHGVILPRHRGRSTAHHSERSSLCIGQHSSGLEHG